MKGAAILEPIFTRQPRHPGVAHYLIHLYDYPPIAEKGLEAARLYAKIAPAAAHAQHMPSHIFTRVGYWQESIDSNIVAARVAKDAADLHEQLHAMDYLVYAYLQLGEDSKARDMLENMRSVTGFTETFSVGPYALAVSPARFAIERGDWKAAAALPVRPTPPLHIEAMTHFACAPGAARTGDPETAKAEIAKLIALRDKLVAAKDGYWSEQVDIQVKVASAWLLEAEGKHADALKAMSEAADAEDRTEKHPVTPGVPKPARELYGAMLLERGIPQRTRRLRGIVLGEARTGWPPMRAPPPRRRSDPAHGVKAPAILREGRHDRRQRGRNPDRGRRRAYFETMSDLTVRAVVLVMFALATPATAEFRRMRARRSG